MSYEQVTIHSTHVRFSYRVVMGTDNNKGVRFKFSLNVIWVINDLFIYAN